MQLPLVPADVRALTVSELARRIRDVLDDGLREVWVVGEISNLRRPSSGHLYFCLKDRQAQVAAVMFRSAGQVLTFRPEDGLEVIVRGRVRLYDVRGDLQLYVDWMEPRGLGGMQLALEQLKKKLAAEGLFAAERKRPLPAWPRAVGVVTALTGAAVQDMLTVLRSRWPATRVVISPVRVQGKGAGPEICAALAALNQVDFVDVVIVGRGGGSVEDLWAFNEERVARAIAASRVPVISAVGHEIDFTVADLVADCRAPTPTAAASMVVPDRQELGERLVVLEHARMLAMQRRLRLAGERVRAGEQRLKDPRRVLETLRQRIDELGERATGGIQRRLRWSRDRLHGTEARLGALSPLAVLERGYSIVRRDDGAVVRRSDEVEVGEALDVLLSQGRLRTRVESK
jgi:exodeoxyribonuclease VII large subunit